MGETVAIPFYVRKICINCGRVKRGWRAKTLVRCSICARRHNDFRRMAKKTHTTGTQV